MNEPPERKVNRSVQDRQTAMNEARNTNSRMEDKGKLRNASLEAVRLQAEQFRALVENVPGAVYRWEADAPWRVHFMSEGVRLLTGRSAKEFVDGTVYWADIVVPEDLSRVERMISDCIDNKRRIEMEYRIVDAAGNIRWVHEKGRAIYDDTGEALFLDGVIIDISDVKQTANGLRESEERFQQLVDHINEVFYISNLEQPEMSYISPGYEAIWGRTTASLYADPLSFVEAIHPEDQERVMASLKNQLKGEATEETYRIIRPDETMRWIRDRAFPVCNSEGRIYRVMGIAEDITQFKQAERALRDSEERFRGIVERSFDSIISMDLEGGVTYVSPAVERLMGYSPEELNGRHIADFIISVDRSRALDALSELRNGKTVEGLQLTMVRDDGVQIYVEVNASPMTIDPQVTGIQAIFRDVTRRKLAEAHLERLAFYDHLTNLPNRSLFQERLLHAVSVADRAGTLVAVMFVDLDSFKAINDSFGHEFGDKVLMTVAERLTNSVRKIDTVARLGGDEFLILLENVSRLKDIEIIAEKIVSTIRELSDVNEHGLSITASIGISVYPNHTTDTRMLLKLSDQAMYAAKRRGRNNYVIHDLKIFGDEHPGRTDH